MNVGNFSYASPTTFSAQQRTPAQAPSITFGKTEWTQQQSNRARLVWDSYGNSWQSGEYQLERAVQDGLFRQGTTWDEIRQAATHNLLAIA